MSIFTRILNLTALLVLLLLASCSRETDQASNPSLDRLATRAQNVTIIRDDFGVPHIYAKTDAGAPDSLKVLCDAWADGLNYYLETHPGVKPMLLSRFEPWMPMFFSEGSIGGDIESVPLDGIKLPFNDEKPSLPIAMASGRWGALASFGAKQYPGTKRIYGSSGNSFVAVVEFGDKVKAKSLLAGGQSGDPNSPHFDDQALPYANVAFKDVPFYREDVEKRAERTYHPGEF